MLYVDVYVGPSHDHIKNISHWEKGLKSSYDFPGSLGINLNLTSGNPERIIPKKIIPACFLAWAKIYYSLLFIKKINFALSITILF